MVVLKDFIIIFIFRGIYNLKVAHYAIYNPKMSCMLFKIQGYFSY